MKNTHGNQSECTQCDSFDIFHNLLYSANSGDVFLIRVLVVDDQDLVRSGICRLLADAEQVEVVGDAASGEEAVQKSRDLEPDVVLMDINMPGIDGMAFHGHTNGQQLIKITVNNFFNVYYCIH